MKHFVSNKLSRDKKGYIKLVDVLYLKKQTRHQKVGLPLEVAQHNALHILNIKDNPNDFYNYAFNMSSLERARIDNWFKVRREKKSHFFAFENKNHKDDSNMWSSSWLQKEVFDRSHKDRNLQDAIRKEKEAGQKIVLHKFLVCSYFKSEKQNKTLMRECDWRVIELGFQVTKESFKKAIGILFRKLYWIKKTFFDKPIQTHLPSYTKNSKPVYSNIESNVILLIDYSIRDIYSMYLRDLNECIPVKDYSYG